MTAYHPTLKQLQYLVALHEHGHFGRAADACCISQSTLSAGLRDLETLLGVLLALPYATGEVESETIELDAFYVAFPKDYFSRKDWPRDPPDEIPPVLIDESRLMLLEDGHCLKDHVLAACNRPELRASATMIGTSLHTLVQMVDNGLGLTMLPEMALDAGILNGTNVVARPLKSDNANREIALVWRKNSPRSEEFRLLAEELRTG